MEYLASIIPCIALCVICISIRTQSQLNKKTQQTYWDVLDLIKDQDKEIESLFDNDNILIEKIIENEKHIGKLADNLNIELDDIEIKDSQTIDLDTQADKKIDRYLDQKNTGMN